jgi:DNA-binding NtrC family response regulator
MDGQLRVMVIDDEAIVGKRLLLALAQSGYAVETFVDPRLALARLNEQEFDIVVTDVRMKDVDGMQVLEEVSRRSPRTKVILITAYATIEVAREAMAKGVFDFLAKPFKVSEMLETLARAAASLAAPGAGTPASAS